MTTAGKFAAHALDQACVDPTNCALARDMAGPLNLQTNMSAFLKASLVFICVVIAIVSSVANESDNFCVVCNKCCQKSVQSTRKILPEDDVYLGCFGILPERTGVLCSSCRRALWSYKTTGKTFFHVSKNLKMQITT